MTTKYFENLKVGDTVQVACYTSMGASSEGARVITNIKTKYDEDSGETFPVICCGSHEFEGVHGDTIKGPSMYYIAEE